MKYVLTLFLLTGMFVSVQVTKTLAILTPDGKETNVPFTALSAYKIHLLDSLRVLNHLKDYKSTLKDVKGVLLKEILSKINFGEESPKVLSQYYITCIADDNYKVVFSWNELFNSGTGDNCLIVTAVNGSPSVNQPTGVLLVTPTDYATGRRYVKNLNTIRIEKVK